MKSSTERKENLKMVEYSFYFINAISGLVGIIIGGFVTFITQIKLLKTRDKLDKKKSYLSPIMTS